MMNVQNYLSNYELANYLRCFPSNHLRKNMQSMPTRRPTAAAIATVATSVSARAAAPAAPVATRAAAPVAAPAAS